jgi:hypothetical protein
LGWLLFVVGLALVGTGIAVAVLTAPNWYVATARVKVEPFPNDGAHYFYEPVFLQKEFELMQSPAVLSNVFLRLDSQTPAGRKLAFLKRLSPADAGAFLRSSLNLRPVRGTSLVEIRISHEDPDAAELLAKTIAAAYEGLPAERWRHYSSAEIAVFEADLRRADLGPEWQDGIKATLLAAREGRLVRQVKVEMVDSFISQVGLEQRLSQWLHPGSYWLPGPPAHPHGSLSLILLAMGVAVGWPGVVLLKR